MHSILSGVTQCVTTERNENEYVDWQSARIASLTTPTTAAGSSASHPAALHRVSGDSEAGGVLNGSSAGVADGALAGVTDGALAGVTERTSADVADGASPQRI